MSVNSTATFLRQEALELDKTKSPEFMKGYLKCIRDFEEFGD